MSESKLPDYRPFNQTLGCGSVDWGKAEIPFKLYAEMCIWLELYQIRNFLSGGADVDQNSTIVSYIPPAFPRYATGLLKTLNCYRNIADKRLHLRVSMDVPTNSSLRQLCWGKKHMSGHLIAPLHDPLNLLQSLPNFPMKVPYLTRRKKTNQLCFVINGSYALLALHLTLAGGIFRFTQL